MQKNCARAEILAGAIALGEATDSERDEYRRHVAACAPCLQAIGGEREIERTMSVVAQARESEIWQPAISGATIRRNRVARVWRFGFSTAALAIVASLAIHFVIASQIRPATVADTAPETLAQGVTTVSLDKPHAVVRPVAPVKERIAPPVPSIVVVHNVVTLKHEDRDDAKPVVSSSKTTVVAEAMPVKGSDSNVPIWRRDEALPSTQGQAHVQAPMLQGNAESIAVAPSYTVHDVTPVGGDTAINPRPPMIAYSLGAEGTTAFEVNVDERGAPVKCTITKSSGYLVLDEAVCKAAMAARYSPRTIDGRAVAGIYRDAFTFRASTNSDNQL